jgi:hypothetical protein
LLALSLKKAESSRRVRVRRAINKDYRSSRRRPIMDPHRPGLPLPAGRGGASSVPGWAAVWRWLMTRPHSIVRLVSPPFPAQPPEMNDIAEAEGGITRSTRSATCRTGDTVAAASFCATRPNFRDAAAQSRAYYSVFPFPSESADSG